MNEEERTWKSIVNFLKWVNNDVKELVIEPEGKDFYYTKKQVNQHRKDFEEAIEKVNKIIEEDGNLKLVDGAHICMVEVTNPRIQELMIAMYGPQYFVEHTVKIPKLDFKDEEGTSTYNIEYLSKIIELAKNCNIYPKLRFKTDYPIRVDLEELGISFYMAPRVDDY